MSQHLQRGREVRSRKIWTVRLETESKVALSVSMEKENIFTLVSEPAENVLRQKTL